MKIALAADHAGYALKETLRARLEAEGHEVSDFGTFSEASCDYPDFAAAAAHAVAEGRADRGLLVCSTGMGMLMAANKIEGVRAALATTPDVVRLTREHNDANVLTIGASFTAADDAAAMARVFLGTPFSSGERHARRIAKMAALERHQEEATRP